ncbi:transmembrane protein 126A-like isoform X2 [Ptychodera flava]
MESKHRNSDDHPVYKEEYLTEREVLDLQWKAISQLPNKEGWPFQTGLVALAANSSFTGLVSLSFYRRMMKVRAGFLLTSIPMAVVPFMTTAMTWHSFLNIPLLMGQINCGVCTQIRGTLLNVVVGAIYPTALAIPLVTSLAIKHKTVEIPKKQGLVGLLKFYTRMNKHMQTRFMTICLYQAVLGYYIATKEFQVYKKMNSYFEPVEEGMDKTY